MNCPRCHVELTEARVDDLVLDRCAGCGGVWLDFAQLDRLLNRESQALRQLVAQDAPRKTGEPDDDEALNCPRCEGALLRMRASADPIVYYGCLTCYGRWLDGQEVNRLVGKPLTAKFEKLFRDLLD